MKDLLQKIGFLPKEGVEGVLYKKYSSYSIEVDFKNNAIHYGGLIVFNDTKKTIQNITKPEDWVVLECVDRLLIKGYKPEDIILEKVYPSGHRTSGRLDILIKKEDKAYLMIECKTWDKEFEREYKKIQKNGGQLFTYFQQDKNTEYLMLYTSRIQNEKIEYKNEIVKIEDYYRTASNVEDVYIRWNKLTNQNGIFEDWANAYDFQNKLLTKKELRPLSEADSGFVFHEFLSILRKHSVSDKPNAFNKIFNLFLAKIYDEKKRADDKLDFQWKEKSDNPVNFQIRLINLHKEGMSEFLKKEIEGIEDSDFNQNLSDREIQKKKKKWLKFNNVFAIKEVIDDESFDDNQRVLKEVVELLQKYQIRYPRKQQHLSDFFERLLTTGLKQESGQFFTPPPIARYIIKSLPIKEYIKESLNSPAAKLPAVIDYAVGSGHFITEMMEEYQNIINTLDTDTFYPDAIKETQTWKQNQYSWASKYIYGIEKDYRLVKVAKVGCYFYGDGLAQVAHGDGLDSFRNSKSYVGLLKQHTTEQDQDNEKFSFVISNPPYSVASFKGDIKNADVETSFELYKYLTDQSSEIECLFIERTKQLLKEGGIAGIILPSSILSNTGIYTKTREIILKYFQIIGITKLGSSTFMATGTNTVILFLRRRDDNDWQNIQNSIDKFFINFQDVTVNGTEHIFSRYVKHAWGDLNFSDYVSLCKRSPNEKVQEHEIIVEYQKKLKAKNDEDLYKEIINIEREKLLYFILAYKQKVVLIKTGEKKAEKQFLGYEFSNRRGHEGMHPIQRNKSIDECTSLFDPNQQENPEKASFYTYKNFLGENFEIDESMQKNISIIDLVGMMTFDRIDFDKNINLSVKKKIKYEETWKTDNLVLLGEISDIKKGTSITSAKIKTGVIPVVAGGKKSAYFHSESNRDGNIITVSASGAYSGFVNYFSEPIFASDSNTIKSKNESNISTKLIFEFLKSIQSEIYFLQRGQAQPHVYGDDLARIKIPLPSKNIQEKIVKEVEKIEKNEEENKKKIEVLEDEVETILETVFRQNKVKISTFASVKGGKRVPKGQSFSIEKTEYPYIRVSDFKNGTVNIEKLQYIDEKIFDEIRNYTISKDDIYISIAGTIGLVGIVPPNLDKKSLTENAAKIVLDTQKNNQKFIYFMLKTKSAKEQINERIKTVGVPKLAIKRIETIKIPLPPLPEQQKIVFEIEKKEKDISDLKNQIKLVTKQKEKVFKKYL
jgi:type I restriction enzyme M protein